MGHVARMKKMRKLYNISVGKSEGNRPDREQDDNIKMDVRVLIGLNWLGLGSRGGIVNLTKILPIPSILNS